MMKIKIFGKIKILTPLIFGPPKFLFILKDLVTLHPCTKFGEISSKGSELEGLKPQKRIYALRAQF